MERELGVRLCNNVPNHGKKYSVFTGDYDRATNGRFVKRHTV